MAKGGCVNGGDLVTTSHSTSIPWTGLYIAAATLVCLICMTYDFLHGLIRRKPFIPCKWFQMNALTLILLQAATKIPVDLTTSMPTAEDQLSKLTGTALLCTTLGFYMPSLGTMDTYERYSNMMALSMMVINVVVSVCIQLRTGLIFAFTTEHIIIIVCMLVLLLLLWSSAIAFRGQIHLSKDCYTFQMREASSNVNDVQQLEELLKKVHVLNYTGNPQSLLCENWHHVVLGLLCVLSFIVVLQATLRSLVFKSMTFYSGVDDYQWSIPFVIVTQLLTIVMGTCSIIYRWFSFICHTNDNVRFANNFLDNFVGRELEDLKLKTFSFRVFEKDISVVLQVPKDVIMELLIRIQYILYGCSKWFVGHLIYGVKKFFGSIITFFNSSRWHDEEELELSGCWIISTMLEDDIFRNWILGMATKEYERWTRKYYERWTKQKNDDVRINCQTPPENPIIPFISKWRHMHASKLECFVLGQMLQRLCWEKYEQYPILRTDAYKVSSLSVLVLSRMLKELMPSLSSSSMPSSSSSSMPSSSSTCWREFVEESSEALDESFDIIYYVDHKTLGDQKQGSGILIAAESRLSLMKHVWANWKNPKHWFHEIISNACTLPEENSSNYSNQLRHACEVLRHARDAMTSYVIATDLKNERQMIWEQKISTLLELSLLCQFILKKNPKSIDDLFNFLAMSFLNLLHLILSALPKAILKEIQGDYPHGICEGNVRKAFKFFYALKSLENKIEWSWEDEVLSESQEKEVESFVDAPDSGAEDDQAEAPSTGAAHTQVGNPIYQPLLDLIDEGV